MGVITKVIERKTGNIKIHGIQSGKLAVKKSALSSKNPGVWSTIWSFKEKEFGEWMPIWSWLIEHPEGLFLIDTGLSADVKQDGYFKDLDFISKYYFEKQMIFEIDEEQEINNQLKKIGIKCQSIDKIILTHLHIDHTGGLKHFPEVPIIVNNREWETMDGSFPKLFPKNIKIEKIKLENRFENFENSYYLTEGKDLIMVETQGHTRGHSSIILKMDDNKLIFFGGDVAYNEKRLLNKVFSATIKDYKKNVDSCNQIMNLATNRSVLFLPSHDFESGNRLIKEVDLKRRNSPTSNLQRK